MRRLLFASFSAAAVLAGFSAISPASAAQDRFCLQGRMWGYPGNCQFATYQQCQAAASGTDAGCGINPAYAYARQRGYYPRY
ncbi:conserved hypothetical protein [Bradyrhizobium sp. ORS 285]|uniref:DUF3551 domain-containing protein n=1 Tax=Bradyrhizobium sp. ORS 285 TaxID=115808 RepID=UPI0002405BD9|nr:DUF3551 domain-containing protein [Bradyrhizobium sp. ORS 285]CCD85416.1 conserved exported hypothetical protein [Bradyrhizobium sp. ORS 285]SMX59995.1 conserved hypothetical protein [Bradyrhizobium sp. ORS 285]